MKFETTRFGLIEYDEEDILQFPDGLYGFEREKQFVLIPFDPNIDCPLEWMQSLTTPGLAFVVTDPYLYMPDYRWIMTPEEERRIEFSGDDELKILVIVTLQEVFTNMTGNFVAPLILNSRTQKARQVVLTTQEYDTRHYLLPEEIRNAEVTAN
jgi:flagellar assembly factor FliW